MAAQQLTPESIRQAAARFLPEDVAVEQLTIIEPSAFGSVQVLRAPPPYRTIVSGIAFLSPAISPGFHDYLLNFSLPSDNSGTPLELAPYEFGLSTTAILFPTQFFGSTPGGGPTSDAWGITAFGANIFMPPPNDGSHVIAAVQGHFFTFGSSGSSSVLFSLGFQVTFGTI